MKDLGDLTPEQSLDVITKHKKGESRTTKRKASARRPNRARGPSNPNRKRSGTKDSVERQWLDGKQKPFIGWDGEGYNAFVCDSAGDGLLSLGYECCGRNVTKVEDFWLLLASTGLVRRHLRYLA